MAAVCCVHVYRQTANLVPVTPMYHEGKLVTMLVSVPDVERVEPLGYWEGPFTSGLFCKVRTLVCGFVCLCSISFCNV